MADIEYSTRAADRLRDAEPDVRRNNSSKDYDDIAFIVFLIC